MSGAVVPSRMLSGLVEELKRSGVSRRIIIATLALRSPGFAAAMQRAFPLGHIKPDRKRYKKIRRVARGILMARGVDLAGIEIELVEEAGPVRLRAAPSAKEVERAQAAIEARRRAARSASREVGEEAPARISDDPNVYPDADTMTVPTRLGDVEVSLTRNNPGEQGDNPGALADLARPGVALGSYEDDEVKE